MHIFSKLISTIAYLSLLCPINTSTFNTLYDATPVVVFLMNFHYVVKAFTVRKMKIAYNYLSAVYLYACKKQNPLALRNKLDCRFSSSYVSMLTNSLKLHSPIAFEFSIDF